MELLTNISFLLKLVNTSMSFYMLIITINNGETVFLFLSTFFETIFMPVNQFQMLQLSLIPLHKSHDDGLLKES